MNEKIVFTRGVPPPEAFPTVELSACFDAAIRDDAPVVLQYGQQPGYAPLREELAREYDVSESEILIGNGSLHLQDLTSAHLVSPGMAVFTEQPSYDRAITTFRRRGARVIGIPLEENGVSVERLKRLYRPRWQAMAAAVRRELPAAQAFIPDGGFFVSVMLPEDAHTEDLVGRARERGLVLTSGAAFFADPHDGHQPPGDRFVRLPFCAVTPEQIEEGVRRLASLL